MRTHKRLTATVMTCLFLFISLFFLRPSSYSSTTIDVEPSVRAAFDREGQGSYMIFFREKANLSVAYSMGWKERGKFVVDSLQRVSTSAQSRVREYLDRRNVLYKAFWVDNVIIVENSDRTVLEGLMAFPEIASIRARRTMELHEPIINVHPDAIPQAVKPNISHVQADSVWSLGYRGTGIVVANIDTGVRYTHEALVGQYRGYLGGTSYNHNYNWWDPSSVCGTPSVAPCDNNGHGTHTMGTIVGDDSAHINQVGMAPGAKWIACKGCESTSCSDSALLGCAQFIVAPTDLSGNNANPDLRPHVVNNSWGGSPGDDWYQGYVNNWHAAGIYPVFSAGNSGPGCSTAGSPGDYGNVTAVGAIDHTNNLPASFSSRGPGAFDDNVNGTPGLLKLKPQVSAPGVNICSAVPDSDSSYHCGYSGTSMAAPHVAGLVALIWNAAPCIARNYSTTETIMQNTATGLTAGSTCGGDPTGVPNNTTGYGLINALAAVQAAIAHCGPTGTLTGTVSDALTGSPIENALIEAGGLSLRTDGTGQYTFQFMPVGTYEMVVSADGYETSSLAGVVVTEDSTTTQNFVLQAGRLEVDVPFIDVALLPNAADLRRFTLTNSGLLSAGFAMKERRRVAAPTRSIPPHQGSIAAVQETSSSGKAPAGPTRDDRSNEVTSITVAGVPAYGIDLLNYQLGSFNTSAPDVWSIIGGIGPDYFFAGDFLGDDFTKLYVLGYTSNQFATIDVNTAIVTPIGTSTPYPGESWSGLAGTDEGTLYGVATSCSSSTLYRIEPSSGLASPIGPITNGPCIIDIAVNGDGEMYAVDIVGDNLVKINPATGAGTVVGSIGFDANYAQGMSFDKATGELYLAAYNIGANRGELRIADTQTGNTVLIGPFSNNTEVDCLAFPSSGSIGWFSESPRTGTIDAGRSIAVDVTFDSTGLASGTYLANLDIENTTPYGTQRIPLTLFVVSEKTKQLNLSAKKKRVNGGDGVIQSSDGVILCGDRCKAKYYQGPRVSLSASAYPGSTFVGWLPASLGCLGTGPCTVSMNKAKKVQAVFVGDYSLTVQKKGNATGRVTSSDSSIDCGSVCGAKYPVHTVVTLEAIPDPGAKLVKWAPASLCPGNGSCQVTLDKARKITAFFDLQ